jgi:hypothetical protein
MNTMISQHRTLLLYVGLCVTFALSMLLITYGQVEQNRLEQLRNSSGYYTSNSQATR